MRIGSEALVVLMALFAASASALPDLTISMVSASNPSPHVGDTFYVYATTSNIGNSTAQASVTQFGSSFGNYTIFWVPALASGQNSTNWTTYTCNQTGTVLFWAFADYYYAVSEANESNNYRQLAVYCAPTQNQTLLPDLTVSMFFLAPGPNGTFQVQVTTTNIGEASSGPSHTISYEVPSGVPHIINVPSLASGSAYTGSYSSSCPHPGLAGFNASADAWWEVNESNEANNFVYSPHTCPTAPPNISNVSATNITYNSAKIRWYTDVLSDSRVEYGTASGNYSYAAGSPLNTTYHLIPLSGLRQFTTYYYRVRSCAPAGNCAYSGEYSFRTTRTPPVLGKFAIDTGLVVAVKSSLEQEISGLGDAVQAQQFAAAARSADALPPEQKVGYLQNLRIAVDSAKKKATDNKAAFSAVLVGGAAVASAWFFWDKRKTKIRARMKDKK